MLAFVGVLAAAAASAATPVSLLGDHADPRQAQRTIVITPATRYVNVTEGDVVTFVSNGNTWAWNFDSPPSVGSFQLNRVAPTGALDHGVIAYIGPNETLEH
jgi:hypothetical protein